MCRHNNLKTITLSIFCHYNIIVHLKKYNVDICRVTPVMRIFSTEIFLKPCFYGLLLLQAPTCGPSGVLCNNRS